MQTVILVDDDEAVRSSLSRGLVAQGYADTYAFADSEAALAMLEIMPDPDRSEALVIMDVELGPAALYGDGCAAAREIVARWPAVRILILTGHDREDVRHRCTGHPPMLEKPVSLRELAQIIGYLFGAPAWRPLRDPNRRRRKRDSRGDAP